MVRADASNNVGGWAWSENVGWMSFNCVNRDWCATSSYGVDIDAITGEVSGEIWSENVGWISFNRSETGVPPDPPYNGSETYIAKMSSCEPHEISGWARALTAASPGSGGWDGWIKFNWDTGSATGAVSLDTLSKEFSGWAWGGNPSSAASTGVIGWMSFNCGNQGGCGTSDYAVTSTISFAPTVSNLSDSFSNYCSQSRIPRLSWDVSCVGPPFDYEIRICSASDCGAPGDPLITDSNQNTNSVEWTPLCAYCCDTPPYNNILWGGNLYHWQVRVKKYTGTAWSDWISDTDGFVTQPHCAPYPYVLCSYNRTDWYDCDGENLPNILDIPADYRSLAADRDGNNIVDGLPQAPAPNQKFYVRDFSTSYATGTDYTYNYASIDCSWEAINTENFNSDDCPTALQSIFYQKKIGGVGATTSDGFATAATSSIIFQEGGDWTIYSTTTDAHSPDQSCGCQEGGPTGLPLPKWKEIKPYSD